MILTTHQPIFLPWPGFFQKMLCADAMVLLDAVQFPRGRGWMTRNRLKCGGGGPKIVADVGAKHLRGPMPATLMLPYRRLWDSPDAGLFFRSL